ncbi:MAG: amino acid adenylation domain-containing protein, partial [bacterium]|nr:amino acid adenylation domain-containing protein [bacterium]
PLFDVMFILNNLDKPKLEIPGLKMKTLDFETGVSKFDLTLHGNDTGQEIFFGVEYRKKLYKRETIERFGGYYKNILYSVVENPGAIIAEIDIITPEEKGDLIHNFNNTESDYPKDKTIHRLFEEQVQQRPDSTAVIGEIHKSESPFKQGVTGGLTYRELNECSNRLARLLQRKGAGPGIIVAIMTDRSIEMVIAVLGTLKAGSAYLPISPGFPQERIKYLLADSNAKILLKEKDYPFSSSQPVILFLDNILVKQDKTQPVPAPTSSELAYVIYTSGSTGQPKGVMVEHCSAVNTLFAIQQQYPMLESDTYLLKTSFVFDVSVSELFGWYLGGGKLAVLEEEAEKDPQRIVDTIERQGITHINFVPSMFNVFVEILGKDNVKKLSTLKYIFLAGEELHPELVEKFRRLKTGKPLENIYGPTEASVYASWYSLADRAPVGQLVSPGGIPIGRPLPNTKLYILDKTGALQPLGVAGELHISGAGVARGYLNKQELTVERFAPHGGELLKGKIKILNNQYPITNNYLYRTGDLARWRPDGNIEFLGRIDHQVKIRGYRIELGEIESRLLTHPQIKEAVVISRQSEDGDKFLCAYYDSGEKPGIQEAGSSERQTGSPDATLLSDYLSQTLPGYMIPAYFMQLEKIPLTSSGKIDHRALPEPEIQTGSRYVAPTGEIEKKLTGIWSEVLGIERKKIGTEANFFQLGGHSLRATIVAMRIHKEFNIKLPLVKLFEASTIRKLAHYIKKSRKETFQSLPTVEKREYYPLTAAQKRFYMMQQLDNKGMMYNMPNVLNVEGDVNSDKIEKIILALIARHECFRTSFITVQGEIVQRVFDNVEFKIERYSDEADVKGFTRPFNLARAPLLRVGLIKITETPPNSPTETDPHNKYILLLDTHHIISDGTSQRLFINELIALYSDVKLLPLKLQYKDYAQWQNSSAGRTNALLQEKYWLKQLQGDITGADLPLDFERPEVQQFKGNIATFELSENDSAALRALALDEGTSLFVLLLTIYSIILSKITSVDDILIGTQVAGRRHAELQDIMGLFLNTLVLRSFPQKQKTFREFLGEVMNETLQAFENQEYPFEDVVEKVLGKRQLNRNPFFDVMFIWQNMERGGHEIPGLKIKPYEEIGELKASSIIDITIYGEDDRVISFYFEYNTELFGRETIESYFLYFKEIVSFITADKNTKLEDIRITHDLAAAQTAVLDEEDDEFGF